MKKIIFHLIFGLAMCSFTFARTQTGLDKVKEIQLLESNRDDVRRFLASYTLKAEEKYHYDRFSTNDGEISVEYSEGNCEEFRTDGYEVPEWKVIYVGIEPDNPVKAEDIGIDLTKYKKEKIYHDVDNYYAYYDKDSGLIFNVRKDKIEEIKIIPSPKYYNLMCDKEKAKILSSTKSIFDRKLKDRSGIISCFAAGVEKLVLSKDKITAGCNSPDLKEKIVCSDSNKIIDVSTIADNPINDVLTYAYIVSGGKIVGTGAKVVWDLTGAKAGTYTITAEVDDGCGFCGTSKIKSVIVKECSGCR